MLLEDTGTHKYLLTDVVSTTAKNQIEYILNIPYPSMGIPDITKYYDNEISKKIGKLCIIYNTELSKAYIIKIISAKHSEISYINPTSSGTKTIAPFDFEFGVRYFKLIRMNDTFNKFTGDAVIRYKQLDKIAYFVIGNTIIKIQKCIPLVEEMNSEETKYGLGTYTTITHTLSPALLGGKRSRKRRPKSRRHAKSRRHKKSRRRYT